MGPRARDGHGQVRTTTATVVVAVLLAVSASACGTGDTSDSSGTRASGTPAQQPAATPDVKSAYAAGYAEGRRLYDSGGKGDAVQEIVWGGCTRRALRAGADADPDRGAWVKGCQDGVGDEPRRPPVRPLTKREPEPQLLKAFRAWARTEGDAASARHARQVVTVELTGPDYDVEVSTDCDSRAEAAKLAGTFVDWWDGDDGMGIARNLVVLDARDRRIATARL